MERIRSWLHHISGTMAGLNRRERILVNSAAVFVAVFLLARFAIVPLSGMKANLRQTLAGKKESLRQMLTVQKEVKAVSRKMHDAVSGLEKQEENFTLFSFLDQLAGEAGVKDSITYMKPSTETSEEGNRRLSLVEMKLEAVNLENLASYLYKIEMSGRAVFVKRLSISRQEKDTGGVDALMQVVTVAG